MEKDSIGDLPETRACCLRVVTREFCGAGAINSGTKHKTLCPNSLLEAVEQGHCLPAAQQCRPYVHKARQGDRCGQYATVQKIEAGLLSPGCTLPHNHGRPHSQFNWDEMGSELLCFLKHP